METIREILGDYARQTSAEALLVKRGDQIPNDVARLAGSRFVSATETEGGRRLAEALVKQVTGGDRITARFLHREYFEFTPTFKLWLGCNHKPRVSGTDSAIWRRIHLIPFNVTIPENERDPELREKLQQEGPGILRWAVDGCREWQADRLRPPESISKATSAYRDESDSVKTFLEECCENDRNSRVPKGLIYECYARWAKSSGEIALTKRDFGSRLLEKGFLEERKKTGRFWVGLRLVEST